MSAPSDLLFARNGCRGGVAVGVRQRPANDSDAVLNSSAILALAVAVAQAPAAAVAPMGAADAPAPKVKINPTKRALRFTVPVNDGASYLGDINLSVAPDDSLSVQTDRLLQMLEPILKADVFSRLKNAAGDRADIGQAQLAAENITLAYDSEKLVLAVGIPVSSRKQSAVSLRDSLDAGVESLEPASVSAFLNFRSAMDFVERGPDHGFGAPVSSIDGALRAFGVVAEGEGYFSLRRGEPLFRRTGSRLIYDDFKNVIRWSVGDLVAFGRTFQSTPSVAGVSASRFYSVLEPWREFRSSGAQNFTLFAPSTVETIVNGRSVERKLLQPGNYTLQDFPLAEGANDVRLQIQDEAGRQRTIDFNLYSNRLLLEPGATEFSAFGGVYTRPMRAGINYSGSWAASGFVRKGLTQQLTAGLNMQADRQAQQVGTELLFGTGIGLIGFDLAASRRAEGGAGYAGTVSYEKVIQSGTGLRSVSLRGLVEMRSANFAIPGALLLREPLALRASAGGALTLGRETFVALDGQYARDRIEHRGRYSLRGSGGIHLGETVSGLAEVQWERGRERDGVILRIGIRKRFGLRGSGQLDVESGGVVRSSYQASKGSGIGAWSGSVDVNRDSNSTSLNANGSYIANRFELGASQFGSHGSAGGISTVRTSVRVGTAIAFADGYFALARPIQQAFLLAEPHVSLHGKSVLLDPVEKSEQARSGLLGGAVDGALSAYSPRTIVYDVPAAPAGYDLGAGNVQLVPPYKAGYKLQIGSDYHLMVIGRLLDRSGEPVSLLAGKAIDLRAPKRPAITMFTSRHGKFGAQGLRPGRWRIEMPTEGGPTIYEVEIKDDPSGTVRVGDLHPVAQGGVK